MLKESTGPASCSVVSNNHGAGRLRARRRTGITNRCKFGRSTAALQPECCDAETVDRERDDSERKAARRQKLSDQG